MIDTTTTFRAIITFDNDELESFGAGELFEELALDIEGVDETCLNHQSWIIVDLGDDPKEISALTDKARLELSKAIEQANERADDPEEEELHRRFDDDILPMVKESYEQDGKPDIGARTEAFNDWTDSLCKNGEISTWLYNNIEHPVSCN